MCLTPTQGKWKKKIFLIWSIICALFAFLDMARKQKYSHKFGLGGGMHTTKRKVLGYGRKAQRFTCCYKEGCSSVLIIRRKMIDRKRNVKSAKRRALKKLDQLYRSPETGQLRKRSVKQLFHG